MTNSQVEVVPKTFGSFPVIKPFKPILNGGGGGVVALISIVENFGETQAIVMKRECSNSSFYFDLKLLMIFYVQFSQQKYVICSKQPPQWLGLNITALLMRDPKCTGS